MRKEIIKTVRVSAVSYLNTIPFTYGLKKSGFLDETTEISIDFPAACAEKLITGKADIGLIPVAAIPNLDSVRIIGDYCIGANGRVKSVLLLSDVPLNEITEVVLDYQSRTSVNLVRVLARKYWNISPQWIKAEPGFETSFSGTKAGVIIGDRTFRLHREFKYVYDLSEEWKKFTGLPFVFAAWVANKSLPENYITAFNKALAYGIANIETAANEYLANNPYPGTDLIAYLTNDIDYRFDSKKREALDLFLSYLKEE